MAYIDRLIRIKSELGRCMLSEFFGTFLLVWIAHSTGGAYSFASEGSGIDKVPKIFAVTFGIGCAALIALTASMPVSGGHINPAITVAVASMGHFPWVRVIPYLIAQHLGGFTAGLVIYITFFDSITKELSKDHSTSLIPPRTTSVLVSVNSSNALLPDLASSTASTSAASTSAGLLNGLKHTSHLFCSSPAPHASMVGAFTGSFLATAVFLIGVAAILDQNSNMKPPKWYWPLGVAFVLMISLAAFGSNGGPSVNPAADLATRIFASLAGWKPVLWSHLNGHYWWIAGLAGPHLGAIFGLWFYRFCISAHYPDSPPVNRRDSEDTEKAQVEMRRLKP